MRAEIIQSLLSLAQSFVGVTEKGGDNCGPEVEKFQKEVNGLASREAWCMCFVQFCLGEIERQYSVLSGVYSSEHCITVWNRTHHTYRTFSGPRPGDIAIWQFYKNGKATISGHTGFVLKVSGDKMTTIEGNTGPGGDIVREGDGVYQKVRSIKGSATMKVVGFIRPFEE